MSGSQFHLGSSRQATYPIGLALDPVLKPIDKSIWATVKALLTENPYKAPTYDDIGAKANCARATISASLKRLRLLRWMTCSVQRSSKGYVTGTDYTLHEWPLDSTTASLCDDTYGDFVRQCTVLDDYVGAIARAVLKTLSLEVSAGLCDAQLGHAESLARLKAYNRLTTEWAANHEFAPELGTYPIAAELIADLRNKAKSLIHDSVQLLNSVPSSCSSSLNTTTSGTEFESTRDLTFPPTLSPDECRLAGLQISTCDPELRQDLLDELAGQISAKAKQGQPVRKPLGYLNALIAAVANHTFHLSAGLLVREQRLEAAKQAAKDAEQQAKATEAARAELGTEPGQAVDVAEIKAKMAKRLGVPGSAGQ